MNTEYIHVEENDGVLFIKMDDPKTRNALGSDMSDEINDQLDRLESDPNLRVLVLSGEDPSFCSGANVRNFNKNIEEREKQAADNLDVEQTISAWERMEAVYANKTDERDRLRFLPLRIHNLQKPSIAMVNGYAMGIGMGMAISCDIRIASDKASFSEAFIRNGLIPADGSCWQLPRMIGLGNTLLLQYLGDLVPADKALQLGLVNEVVEHDKLLDTTMELAKRIAQGPTYSMSLIKYLVQKSLYTNLEDSLKIASVAQNIARGTEDHKEGVRAFLEKRKPNFKGR
ncbi:MAG: enoyl-CoA hydratase/isomerase family protein [Dehalococcoidia bacterium]|nr:2-(1,2-epoxy-1,2-dihydrophenyl)acetyl-CoA isomerase [Chloroflexota bacterium]|tara:strand:- start:1261 stop:2118 length:858 start_codon:yes stop_codon:yes gene_type:complete